MKSIYSYRAKKQKDFLQQKIGTIIDYDLMVELLDLPNSRRDNSVLAKEIIIKYGSFAKAINAENDDLLKIKGISTSTLNLFSLIKEGARRLIQEESNHKILISSWKDLLDYCRITLIDIKYKAFIVLFLNSQNELLGQNIFAYDEYDCVQLSYKEILKDSLIFGACSIILVRNHLVLKTGASKVDKDILKEIKLSTYSFNIKIHDFIIFSEKHFFSFKDKGLL